MKRLLTKVKKINFSKKNKRITFDESPVASNLIGTAVPNRIKYQGGNQSTDVEKYIPSVIVKSNAKDRIGLKNEREQVEVRQKETRIGKSFGNVTLVGNEKRLGEFEAGREGKDIKSISLKRTVLSPRITIGNNFEENEIDNTIDLTVYGQGSFFKIYDENFNLIPFRDFPGKLNPIDLIGRSHITTYPFVSDLKINFEQFVDPSISSFDGAVDAISSRQSLIDNNIEDFTIRSLKCDMMGGGVEYSQKGNLVIEDKKEVKSGDKDYFLDSQETLFPGFEFPQVGNIGAGGRTFGIQGYSSDAFYKLSPYNDKKVREDESRYTFLTINQKEVLLSESDRNKSEVGERFKSSNKGFFFGESNVLGTDSVAFGGLKK